MSSDEAKVIREGRNVLFERGWWKGATTGPDDEVCSYHALALAAERVRGPYCGRALDLGAPEHLAASTYQDLPDTTFDDVLAMFDRAEKIAESRADSGVGGVS